MSTQNNTFELGGVHHVALVCRDMARTVEFYTQVLGMPLTKTIALPNGGQHFFFDVGNGDHLAFFWFPGAHEAAPGISSPAALPGGGDIATAHGSMNHLAFNVPLERFEEYRQTLLDRGVAVSPVLDHDDSPSTVAREFHPGVFVRSFYFRDPDGVLLEFASWCRDLAGEGDVVHDPVNAEGEAVPLSSVYPSLAQV
jgi:catechol 2,3-dioxygenase-like lactoylglutathione lyase family enzyme